MHDIGLDSKIAIIAIVFGISLYLQIIASSILMVPGGVIVYGMGLIIMTTINIMLSSSIELEFVSNDKDKLHLLFILLVLSFIVPIFVFLITLIDVYGYFLRGRIWRRKKQYW